MICDNLSINEKGHLTFAGLDAVELAEKYGTPLYVMDENKIREHIRTYKDAMFKHFPSGSMPEFASKALSIKQMYRILKEEGIDADVVSCGELYTAFAAGFPMSRVFFHGNNKTDSDIQFALEKGVGYFVCDNADEVVALNKIAKDFGIRQNVLLRVSPGIDPHTHKKISTGSVDSKFGVAIETGQALELTQQILNCENLNLVGFHCHIGSQIFESEPFITAAEIMIKFICEVESKLSYKAEMLNLGGGFGVRYVESEPEIDYAEKIEELAKAIENICKENNTQVPIIHLEPGRSLVADAGITLYKIGSVKEIKEHKNYVSIDGGMADNPRYTLYESPYTVILASRADEKCDFCADIAGRCCESGDIIQENVSLPKPNRNEILAVLTTGAYNYSMASNYNRLQKPPVVMIKDGKDYLAVKRESFEDITNLDI